MSVLTDEVPPADAPTQPMLELFIDASPEGEAEATVPVRWCVSQELTRKLAEEGVAKPFLLLIVRSFATEGGRRYYTGAERRKLVPLVNEMVYVSFSRPGNNEVTACVVYNEAGKGSWELNTVFVDSQKNIFAGDGNEIVPGEYTRQPHKQVYSGCVLADAYDTETVFVPAELFAPDPPQWAKDYLGKFGKSKGVDQCGTRKRWLFAAPFAFIYFPVAYLIRFGQLLLGAILGWRNMQFRSFRHPLKYNILDVTDELNVSRDGLFWWKDDNKKMRPLYRWPLNLLTPLVIGSIYWALGTIHVTRSYVNSEGVTKEHIVGWIGWPWWKYFAVVGAAHIAVSLLIILVGVILMVGGAILGTTLSSTTSAAIQNWVSKTWKGYKSTREVTRERKLREQREAIREELLTMVCSSSSAQPSLSALPKRKRTVRLRFQSTKKKVCRPYAS